MRIAVVGATGKSGQAFVKHAVAQGHDITAGFHEHTELPIDDHITAMQCDATNPADVRALVQGQDAVVSLLGHGPKTPPHMQRDAMKTIAAAMRLAGVKRLVSLTGVGVRVPGDHITPIDALLNTVIHTIDPNRIDDGIEHLKVLEDSSVDWTVLRVMKLTNGGARPYTLSEHGPATFFVSRKTVARAILEVLDKQSFIRQSPIIGR